MYWDTILKYSHLKQARTNTIYNIFEKNYIVRFEMFGRIFLFGRIFSVEKKFKKLKIDVLEIALDQWNERVRRYLANEICLFALFPVLCCF